MVSYPVGQKLIGLIARDISHASSVIVVAQHNRQDASNGPIGLHSGRSCTVSRCTSFPSQPTINELHNHSSAFLIYRKFICGQLICYRIILNCFVVKPFADCRQKCGFTGFLQNAQRARSVKFQQTLRQRALTFRAVRITHRVCRAISHMPRSMHCAGLTDCQQSLCRFTRR